MNNFDEDDSGIFRYLLDESLKDAWDRLLRIRASYVPQYQIEVYLKSFGLVAVILLEKELFKISLLVPVLYLLWAVLFFIEQVVLRTLLPCL